MIHLEQTLQDLHIDERDTAVGKQWHSLTVPEIERIKEIFIMAGFKPPANLGEMVVGRIIYDRLADELTKILSNELYNEVMRAIAVACEVENE